MLLIIFNHLSSQISEPGSRSTLSKFQQFIMVLMKLRLNLFDTDIAYRFGTAQSTVSRNFKKWLNIMFTGLKHLIVWPERAQLRKTLPS